MDKHGIAWKFVLGLVIAALLMTVGCKAVANFINLFNSGPQKSFQEFSDVLSQVAQGTSGEMESIVLNLPKKGGIVGFNEGPYYHFKFGSENKGTQEDYVFMKPPRCGESACICLCMDILRLSGDSARKNYQKQLGDEQYTQVMERRDFANAGSAFVCAEPDKKSVLCAQKSMLFSKTFAECNAVITDSCIRESYTGGFLVLKEELPQTKERNSPKLIGVSVENYHGLVGVCLEPPCFSPQQKKSVDFSVVFKESLKQCISRIYCNSGVDVLRSLVESDEKSSWVLVFDTKKVKKERLLSGNDGNAELNAIVLRLKNEKLSMDEAVYLVENPNGISGPFREDPRSPPFAFDEFDSLPFSGLEMRIVTVDPVTELPPDDGFSAVDEFTLIVEDDEVLLKQDRFLRPDKKYLLVAMGNGNEYLHDPFPEGQEPKPPFPLVFYVKEKT